MTFILEKKLLIVEDDRIFRKSLVVRPLGGNLGGVSP